MAIPRPEVLDPNSDAAAVGRGAQPSPGRADRDLAAELAPLLRLAGPAALAEFAWFTMGLIDTALAGRAGRVALGAISLGSNIFYAVAIFGIGALLGLDYTVAHALGSGRRADARRALVNAVWLSLGLAFLMVLLLHGCVALLGRVGVVGETLAQASAYLTALTWSAPLLLLTTCLELYLIGVGRTRPLVYAAVLENLLHLGLSWVLVLGHLGAPALGVRALAWSTCVARGCGVLLLLVYTHRDLASAHSRWKPAWAELGALLRLGLPAAGQKTLDLGAIAVVTLLAARLDEDSLAAHQVVLTIATFTFMAPQGVAQAAAVRVGQALGAANLRAVARAGTTALLLGAGLTGLASLLVVTFPGAVLRLITPDAGTIACAMAVLPVSAAFQILDGTQGIATAALRGTGETQKPMTINLVGHWLVGIPSAYLLAFRAHLGVVGLWLGLTLGMVTVSAVLVWRFYRRCVRLRERTSGQD